MQEDALDSEKDPAGHSSHLVAPDLLLNVPSEHLKHVVDPVLLE